VVQCQVTKDSKRSKVSINQEVEVEEEEKVLDLQALTHLVEVKMMLLVRATAGKCR